MTHHAVDSHTIRRVLRLLEKTYVGIADQEELLESVTRLRRALSTPLDTTTSQPVITSAGSVSS